MGILAKAAAVSPGEAEAWLAEVGPGLTAALRPALAALPPYAPPPHAPAFAGLRWRLDLDVHLIPPLFQLRGRILGIQVSSRASEELMEPVLTAELATTGPAETLLFEVDMGRVGRRGNEEGEVADEGGGRERILRLPRGRPWPPQKPPVPQTPSQHG